MWKKFQKNVGLQILYALLCWNTAKSKKVISNQTNSKFPKFVKSGKVCFTGQIIYSACNELNMLSYLCQRKYQWQVFRKKSFPYGCWFFLVYTNLVEVNTRLICVVNQCHGLSTFSDFNFFFNVYCAVGKLLSWVNSKIRLDWIRLDLFQLK